MPTDAPWPFPKLLTLDGRKKPTSVEGTWSMLDVQPCEDPFRWVVCGHSVAVPAQGRPTGPSLPSAGTFFGCCSSQGNEALLQAASVGLCSIDLLLKSNIP